MEYLSLILSAAIFLGSILAFIYLVISKKKIKRELHDGNKIKESNIKKYTKELIPIRRYLPENECFELENLTYIDIFEVQCKDLINASDGENEYDCLKFTKVYRTYPGEIKLISLNFPSNTREQQKFFNYKIEHTKNQIQKNWLQKMLLELIWVEKNKTNREFYFMIFASTLEEMYNKKNNIAGTLGNGRDGLIAFISHGKKENILFKLNNKNSFIL